MKRRQFIALAGGVVASWPLVARAQQDRVRRIGILMGYEEDDPDTQARMKAFREAFEQLGWKDGRNVQLTYRFGNGEINRIRGFAKELIDGSPDVIVCETTPTLRMVREQTATLPTVFISVTDPIASGFVTDLAHPGGNMTGFTNFETTMGGKWIELLKKLAPGISRVGVMFNPESATGRGQFFLRPIETSAPSLAVTVLPLPVHSDADIAAATTTLASQPDSALIVVLDVFTAVHRPVIIADTAAHRIPTIFPWRFGAADGGLMSYGVDVADLHRRAAAYVDRILMGTKPGDLPVQQPIKFELVINLKTAKALGIDVPPVLLATADEVIE
jgi:putative ABC transport system substrate-binding protein